MPFSFFVAFKYLLDEKRQTLFIMSACAIGVAVMVFLYGLIEGLQRSLVERTLGSQAHIVLNAHKEKPRPLAEGSAGTAVMARVERGFDRPQMINDWPRRLEAIRASADIVAAAPLLTGAALIRRGDVVRPVGLSGIEPDSFTRIIPLGANLVAGSLDLAGDGVVIGKDLADDLGVAVDDRLTLQTAGGAVNFIVGAIFDLGNRGVNESQVFIPLRQAQALLGTPGDINQIDTRVDEIFGAERIARRLEKETGIETVSWMEENSQLLIALRSQSSSSYLIQFFVMVAVALGIASVLVVSVVQKRGEIGIMRAFGTRRSVVTRIFLIQGAVVGLFGSTVGCAIGTGLAMFFRNLVKNPDGTPTFPINYDLPEYLVFIAIATLVGILAAALPARQAARVNPAEVVH